MIGQTISHYLILAKIGQGGMGVVYRAHDEQLDRDVAIKLLPAATLSDETARARLLREARMASALNNPYICTIHEVGQANSQIFVVMELVEGQPLSTLISPGGLSPETTIRYGKQIAEALEHAHGRGIIHRDLKGSNVVVTPEGRVKVLDFGLAKRMLQDEPDGPTMSGASLTQAGQLVGTLHYMAPEVLRGQPGDARSDVWSLGVLLSEMASGQLPFKGTTLFELSSMILHEPPAPLPPLLPAGLRAVIQRCLAKDATERYQHAGEVRVALDVTSPATIPIVAQTASPRRRWLFALSGLFVVSVALLAVRNAGVLRQRLFGSGAKEMGRVLGLPPMGQGKYLTVLPFRVLGDRASLGYMADGIAEALTAKLFNLPGLHVIANQSVKEADLEQPLEKIAGASGANLAITGTIQGTADKMRVTANLQDVVDNRRLWSGELTGAPQNLLMLEDEMYNKIVAALDLNPTREETNRGEQHPTENVEAYDSYLRGREMMRNQQSAKEIDTALHYYDDALQKDPRFALAYTGIADASLAMYSKNKESFWSNKALAAATQAQQINDTLPEVHLTMGSVYIRTGKPSEAVEELKRAIALTPNSDVGYLRLGSAYLALGKKDEMIKAYQRAIQIDPYYWGNYNAEGSAYFQLGDYDKALASYQRVVELAPGRAGGYENMGAVYFSQGKFSQSIPYFEKCISLAPQANCYSNIGTAYFYLQRYAESVTMFEKALVINPNDEELAGNLADAYRWNGQRDKSLATYDKAIALAYQQLQVNLRKADTMGRLALYYAKKGNAAQSMEWINRAHSIDPNSIELIYCAAVVHALGNQPDEALKYLREGFQKGYSTEEARRDPEFKSLQSHREFSEMLAEFGRAQK
jgi:tetratricopeptide (TPR) repeat protein/TolB-like protein